MELRINRVRINRARPVMVVKESPSDIYAMVDPGVEGGEGRTSLGLISFIYTQFSAKILSNYFFLPPNSGVGALVLEILDPPLLCTLSNSY